MNLISAFAVYFIIWWLVLFVVLPIGIQGPKDDSEVILGTDPGAPARPMLARKVLITSLVASVVFAAVYVAFEVYGFTLEDLIF
jgi:predicted secreted protein